MPSTVAIAAGRQRRIAPEEAVHWGLGRCPSTRCRVIPTPGIAVYGGGVTTGARLLTLFAVLVGIFLMHGLPAQSCAAGSGDMSTVITVDHAPHLGPAMGPAMGPGHGGVCVFTMPSRDHAPVLALVLLLVAVLLTVLWRPLLVGGPGRRGPPVSGVQLLTVVCVSRT